jgi:hypothetical protein
MLNMNLIFRQAVGLVVLGAASFVATAQQAGEVEFARGVGFAQSDGQTPRVLGKGLPLKEGDRLTTSDGSTVIVKLLDGTRMTVRPNSEMIVQQYRFAEGAKDNSMVMQLLRGGFRAITGLISKSSPEAAKVHTATATIGIRGTDFDARICTQDCKKESSQVNENEKARPNTVMASAKLVSGQGEVHATDPAGVRRIVVAGGSVYPGETVDTAAGAKVLLAFRDESRLTLGGNTQFKVDSFVFDDKNPAEGRFLVTLLRGSMRALTGLIGKANNRNVGFTTATATIGIRGTGLDMDCGSGDSCSFFTWLGTIVVGPNGQTALQTLQAGQGLYVSRTGVRTLLNQPTLSDLPRPDSVPVNTQQLFSQGEPNAPEEGLFVYVRDGHVELSSERETVHLGRGETGFSDPSGHTGRPRDTPLFIQYDKVPMPNSTNLTSINLTGDPNAPPSKQCR